MNRPFLLGLFVEIVVFGIINAATAENLDAIQREASSRRQAAMTELLKEQPGVLFFESGSRIVTLYGPAIGYGNSPADAAEKFRSKYVGVFGVPIEQLDPRGPLEDQRHALPVMFDAATGQYKFTLVYYSQWQDGVPVFRSDLRILVRNEPGSPVVLARSSLRNIGGLRVAAPFVPAPNVGQGQALALVPNLIRFTAPKPVIWAGVEDQEVEPVLAVEFTGDTANSLGPQPYEKWLFVADAATGMVLYRENQILSVDVSGSVNGNGTQGIGADICEPETGVPMPYARVSTTGAAPWTYANSQGSFTIPNSGMSQVTVTSEIAGKRFSIFNSASGDTITTLTTDVTPPGPANITHNLANASEFNRAEVNAYVAANAARDYVLAYDPNYPTISTETDFPVYVNRTGGDCPTYLAWYNPGTSLNFCRADGGHSNTAFNTIVYHEYGHHVVQSGGSGQGEYGEGMSDCMAVLISDQPRLGVGIHNNCTAELRTADNSCQYLTTGCSSCGSAIHACGNLLSGCVWSTRNELQARYPSTYRQILSALTVNSVLLHTGTTITPQITVDFLTLDDDDADITNGTPHIGAIDAGFRAHNMPAPRPVNDLCSNATSVAEGTYRGTNAGAQTESVATCGNGGANDVWWLYTASVSAVATISTCGSDFDTVLSIHPTCIGQASACNDNACGVQSSLSLAVTQGQSYLIRIAGKDGAVGNITLNIAGSSPSLSSGSVTPTSGTDLTTYTFDVTYRDPSGQTPVQQYVEIQKIGESICGGPTWCNRIMTPVSGNISTGRLYRHTTQLSSGSYRYRFHFAAPGFGELYWPDQNGAEGPSVGTPGALQITCTSVPAGPNAYQIGDMPVLQATVRDPSGNLFDAQGVIVYISPGGTGTEIPMIRTALGQFQSSANTNWRFGCDCYTFNLVAWHPQYSSGQCVLQFQPCTCPGFTPVQVNAFAASPASMCQGTGFTVLGHSINLDAFETLGIRSASGTVVRTLVDHQQRAAGAWSDPWDGSDDSAQPVPPGDYAAELEAIHLDPNRAFEDFSPQGTGHCNVYYPQGLAVAPDGTVYVMDLLPTANRKIVRYAASSLICQGEFTPPIGSGAGQLNVLNNQGMAVDGQNRLHILDDVGGFRRITVWNGLTGEWITEYGGSQMMWTVNYPYLAPLYYHAQTNRMYTWANDPGQGCKVFIFDATTGSLINKLDPLPGDATNVPTATGIAVDAENNIWISVQFAGTFVMDHSGQVLRQLSGDPHWGGCRILIRQGRIVYTALNDQIKVWDLRGDLLQTISIAGDTLQGGLCLAGGTGQYLYGTHVFQPGNGWHISDWSGSRIRDFSSSDFRGTSITITAGIPSGIPTNQAPPDLATCQPTTACLDWSDVNDATSYDVYWGTVNPPPFWENSSTSTACPPNQDGQTYYWFAVPRSSCGVGTAGAIWSYTTGAAVSAAPTNLTPSNGAICLPPSTCLDWSDVSGATSYDLFLGTTNPPPFYQTVPGSSVCPPGQAELTYYWYVRARNTCGLGPAGPTWSYSTSASPCFVDCNQNGIADDQDIANGTSQDCNNNAIPDECDIAAGGQPEWLERITTGLSPRGASGISETANGCALLYGGSDGTGILDGTWEWNGVAWAQLAGGTGPGPRYHLAMAFDSIRNRVVLFGGNDCGCAGGYRDDTWEWNGATWTQAATGSPAGARGTHKMAFDSDRGRVVLFGGSGGGANLPGTWEWNGGAASWTQVSTTTEPPLRGRHAMAYDAARHRTVLFGGDNGNGATVYGDTWLFDGTDWSPGPANGPPARFGHTMAFDPIRQRVVLFGGVPSSFGQALGDTWEWDGTEWAQVPSAGPSARAGHSMAYCAASQKIVLFGGGPNGGPPQGDTWEFEASSNDCNANGILDECEVASPQVEWFPRLVNGPTPRSYHASAYDPIRSVTVLFGGLTNGDVKNGETWGWKGNTWTLRSSTGPSPRGLHTMVYDSGRDVIVLFGGRTDGGFNGETWEWDGIAWILRSSSGPSPRELHAMAYDAGRGVTVLFGGGIDGGLSDETWEWNGGGWIPHPSTGPSQRYQHAMAYDAGRGVTVLFGGVTTGDVRNGETWEWNGSDWTLRSSGGPSPRAGHALAYDAGRGRTVLSAGGTNSGLSAETWEWDGGTWTLRANSGPSPRYGHALVFDAGRGTSVLFGGRESVSGLFGDTWELVSISHDCNTNGIPDDCEAPLLPSTFVEVLLDIDIDPVDRCLADLNRDGAADGRDVQAYLRSLLGP